MQRIYIHDVVARDGLQIEPQFIPTEQKIELIDRLSGTGIAKIEATSFVSPKAVARDGRQRGRDRACGVGVGDA